MRIVADEMSAWMLIIFAVIGMAQIFTFGFDLIKKYWTNKNQG